MLKDFFTSYAERLSHTLRTADWQPVEALALALRDCWRDGRQVFMCGNGGSAGNALHLASDFLYGIGKERCPGMRVQALSANASVLTCLGNDIGYDKVFSQQLEVMADTGDVLIVFSGSGNSANIIKAIEVAQSKGVKTFGVLGYDGGKAKDLVDVPIHFPVNDMQISEDVQLILGHMLMQWLYANPIE